MAPAAQRPRLPKDQRVSIAVNPRRAVRLMSGWGYFVAGGPAARTMPSRDRGGFQSTRAAHMTKGR